MATIKSEYYRFNGLDWDLHYFKTSADLILETASYKVMTAAERTSIATYLATFNAANKLAQIEAAGKLPASIIPALGYLPIGGGTLSGELHGTSGSFTGGLDIGGALFANGGINSDNGYVSFIGQDSVRFGGAVLMNVGEPGSASDAATKGYVDGLVAAGMRPVAAVTVATTANVTLSGLTTHDGYTLQAGNRVLVWKQTTPSQNGIYTAASGAWAKVNADSAQGAFVFVENGTLYNDWFFHCQDANGTWIDHSRPDTIKAGSGLTKSGTTLSIAAGGVTNTLIANGTIAWTKFATQALSDNASESYDTWAKLSDATLAQNMTARLSEVLAAIGKLRGTANYNTNNTETIAGAYVLANSKIKSTIGASVPGTSGYVAGDLFFKTLA